jgi:hypothetical protein
MDNHSFLPNWVLPLGCGSRWLIRVWLLALMLPVLMLTASVADAGAQAEVVRADELMVTGLAMGGGAGQGTVVTADGLTLEGGSSGSYTSPVFSAGLPFSDIGAMWRIDLPAGAGFYLWVRTSSDGVEWSPWTAVEGELDWVRPETNEWVGDLVGVPQSVRVHRYVQLRWRLEAGEKGLAPLVRYVRLAFIDSGIIAASKLAEAAGATSQPSIITRTQWGCPDGQNSPQWAPEYFAVTHAIVHHTVTPNTDTDHAARVRSIWYYHAITRGWGDIGYNYVVARDGSLYEGRAGGDDVKAGHAYPYNFYSLGLAFMGTFTDQPAPQPMLEGAADLLSWKFVQKGIDPQSSAWLRMPPPGTPNVPVPRPPDLWRPTITAHRDVGQTECPGSALYAQLPTLREEVSGRVDSALYTTVDDNQVVLGGPPAYWRDGPAGCGYGGHAYWTFSMATGPAVNWARWQPDLPETGTYRVYAYVPYCLNDYPDSTGVSYLIHHAGGETTVQVNQAVVAGSWVDLGRYDFAAGTAGYLYLDDVATDSNRTIWVDATRWRWEASVVLPPANLSPADGSWVAHREVNFRWTASLSGNVDRYLLRIATDANLTNLVHQTWSDQLVNPSYTYLFSADHVRLYWGVQAYTAYGSSKVSGPWTVGVDTLGPAAAVRHVLRLSDNTYLVSWYGQDLMSGLATYDVQYRLGTGGTWLPWYSQTTAVNGRWTDPVTQSVFFRVRATDVAGNTGAYDAGTANTDNAIDVEIQSWYPLLFRR